MGEDVDLMVNYPNKVANKGPGSISFEVDNGPDMVRVLPAVLCCAD
jgi:hypothetical protein